MPSRCLPKKSHCACARDMRLDGGAIDNVQGKRKHKYLLALIPPLNSHHKGRHFDRESVVIVLGGRQTVKAAKPFLRVVSQVSAVAKNFRLFLRAARQPSASGGRCPTAWNSSPGP